MGAMEAVEIQAQNWYSNMLSLFSRSTLGDTFCDAVERMVEERRKKGVGQKRIRWILYCHWAHALYVSFFVVSHLFTLYMYIEMCLSYRTASYHSYFYLYELLAFYV